MESQTVNGLLKLLTVVLFACLATWFLTTVVWTQPPDKHKTGWEEIAESPGGCRIYKRHLPEHRVTIYAVDNGGMRDTVQVVPDPVSPK